MGKSRLVAEFCQSVTAQSLTMVGGRCVSYGLAVPWGPVIDIVRGLCGISEQDPADSVERKVHSTRRTSASVEATRRRFCASWRSARATSRSRTWPGGDPGADRRAVRDMILARARSRPLLLVIEDLHWIDRPSEELLVSLVAAMDGARIMLVCTFRPGYAAPWVDHPRASELTLGALTPDDSIEVARGVLGRDLGRPLMEMVLQRAEGNPLFVQELARELSEHGPADAACRPPSTTCWRRA